MHKNEIIYESREYSMKSIYDESVQLLYKLLKTVAIDCESLEDNQNIRDLFKIKNNAVCVLNIELLKIYMKLNLEIFEGL